MHGRLVSGTAYNLAQGWKSGSSSALRGGREGEVIFAHSRLGGKAEDGDRTLLREEYGQRQGRGSEVSIPSTTPLWTSPVGGGDFPLFPDLCLL